MAVPNGKLLFFILSKYTEHCSARCYSWSHFWNSQQRPRRQTQATELIQPTHTEPPRRGLGKPESVTAAQCPRFLAALASYFCTFLKARISHLAYQEVSFLTSSQQSTLSPLGAGHTHISEAWCPPHSLPSICHTVFSIWGQGP